MFFHASNDGIKWFGVHVRRNNICHDCVEKRLGSVQNWHKDVRAHKQHGLILEHSCHTDRPVHFRYSFRIMSAQTATKMLPLWKGAVWTTMVIVSPDELRQLAGAQSRQNQMVLMREGNVSTQIQELKDDNLRDAIRDMRQDLKILQQQQCPMPSKNNWIKNYSKK